VGVQSKGKGADQADFDCRFAEANRRWEQGHLRSAFRLFLIAAKKGDPGAQLNLGNFYCDGIGVKPNQEKAFYWYRRAYLRGSDTAANNIGILLRNEKQYDRALAWFARAVKLGDAGAHVEMAKIHILIGERAKAVPHLKRASAAGRHHITDADREESRSILAQQQTLRSGRSTSHSEENQL
jgi:TPR repeat protein